MTVVGSSLPSTATTATDPGLSVFAAAAEAAGAGSLWVADHVLLPHVSRSAYPYAADGRLRVPAETPWYEALTCCTWAAASTSTARVGTAVLVLPQRHPLEVAKVASTLDALSGGRFALGVGVGWLREEFEALGWDFKTRGRRTDEAIALLRAAWSGDPTFEGEFFTVESGLAMFPRPAHVPILVGGMSAPALRRAARLGDGWLAHVNLAELDAPALIADLERLRGLRAPGRPPLQTVLRIVGPIGADAVAGVLPVLRELADAGFDEIAIDPPWPDVDAGRRVLATVAEALG